MSIASAPVGHTSFTSYDRLVQNLHDRMAQGAGMAGGDPFVIEIPWMQVPAGHERLTTLAASGLPGIAPADLAALITGVRRVDTEKLSNHFKPEQQCRHVLRRYKCQPQREALIEARRHLAILYRRIRRTPARPERFALMGEALHLIQDSYSPAHAARDGGTGPITFIRYYRLDGLPYPQEHRVLPMRAPGQWIPRPIDPRDYISSGGALTPSAAAAVRASRSFLRMMARHLGAPAAGLTPLQWRSLRLAQLRRFMNRHLILSGHVTETKSLYPSCP